MADFDPAKYADQVAAQAKGDFDPATYADEVAAKPPQKPVTLGAGTTTALHAARHLAFGLGDNIIALEQALGGGLGDSRAVVSRNGETTVEKRSLWDRYLQNLSFNDRLLEDSDKEHPTARWVGNGLGFIGNAAALAGVAPARAALAARGFVPAAEPVVQAAGVFGRAYQGAKEGAKVGGKIGGLVGLLGSRSDTITGTAVDTGLGASVGAVGGGVLGAGGGTLGALLANKAKPTPAIAAALEQEAKDMVARGEVPPAFMTKVEPSEEAQTLQRFNVRLPLGNQQPNGWVNVVQESAKRVPGLDKTIKAQEAAALGDWHDAYLNEARLNPTTRGDGSIIKELGRIKSELNGAYEHIADKPVPIGATHPETGRLVNPEEALKFIINDPGYQAGPENKSIVTDVFKNELGKLYEATDGGDKPISARLLINMRHALREAAHDATMEEAYTRANMFHDAAESIGGGLKAGLSPEDANFLRRVDSKYSNFMRVRDAVFKGITNDESGAFTPKQMGGVMKQSYGKRLATDTEAGGPLMVLTRAGLKVFAKDPQTGHGDFMRGKVGLAFGPALAAANASPEAQAAFVRAAAAAANAPPREAPNLWRLAAGIDSATPAGVLPAELSQNLAQLAGLLKRGNQ